MEAVHVFGKVYGWSFEDTLRLTYRQMQTFLNKIQRDNMREQQAAAQARARRGR